MKFQERISAAAFKKIKKKHSGADIVFFLSACVTLSLVERERRSVKFSKEL